jgi:hypothetical protein
MVEIGKKGKESLGFLKEIQSAAENLCAAMPPNSLRRMNPRFLWDVFGPYVLSERTSAGSYIAAGGKTVDESGQGVIVALHFFQFSDAKQRVA